MTKDYIKQHDDSRSGSYHSGGKRIDDHKFWAGSKGEASVFPDGPHKEKHEHSSEGGGNVMKYEDTTEEIKKYQDKGTNHIRRHGRKEGNRN